MSYPFYLSCADPGVITGLALFHVTATELVRLETAAVVYDIDNYLTPLDTLKTWAGLPGRHRFVGESFHTRPGPVIPDTTPERVIDHIKVWQRNDRPYTSVTWQEPVAAKTQVPDTLLKKIGLLVKGKTSPHENDATRHGIAYLFTMRHRPTCELFFPRRVRAGR